MANMAVFDSPQLPHGWQGREVIRVIEPLGCATAWVDPALAGAVARKSAGTPRSPVIESLPLEQAGQPFAVGCELLLLDGASTVTSARMRFAREEDAIDGVDCLGSSNLTCTWREVDAREWQRLALLPDRRAAAPVAKDTVLAELTIVPVAGR